MSKEYFSHDYSTRNKTRMAALLHKEKARGYGLFWIIVEMLYEDSGKWMDLDECTYMAIEKESGEPAEYVKEFIDRGINFYKVFICEDGKFSTERVLRNIEKRKEISEKKSEAGKKSAIAKRYMSAVNQHNSTGVKQKTNGVEHNSTKEIKGKEIKVNTNRAKALVVSDETPGPTKDEYDSLTKEIEGQELKIVVGALKEFLVKKPYFLEPYADYWNIAIKLKDKDIPEVKSLTDPRLKKLKTRIREPGFDFLEIMKKIRESRKLGYDTGWFSFDWVFENESNYVKILEGNYDN